MIMTCYQLKCDRCGRYTESFLDKSDFTVREILNEYGWSSDARIVWDKQCYYHYCQMCTQYFNNTKRVDDL